MITGNWYPANNAGSGAVVSYLRLIGDRLVLAFVRETREGHYELLCRVDQIDSEDKAYDWRKVRFRVTKHLSVLEAQLAASLWTGNVEREILSATTFRNN